MTAYNINKSGKDNNSKKSSTFESRINEFKGELQSFWGDLTENEMDKLKGNIKSVTSLIDQKLEQGAEVSKSKLEDLKTRLMGLSSSASDSTNEFIDKTISRINSKLERSKENLRKTDDGGGDSTATNN